MMGNKCPKCNAKMPLKKFLYPIATIGYNNIDDDVYICPECHSYIEWTTNRKIAAAIALAVTPIYLYIAGSLVTDIWFLKVIVPAALFYLGILLFFPNQMKVREVKDYSLDQVEK